MEYHLAKRKTVESNFIYSKASIGFVVSTWERKRGVGALEASTTLLAKVITDIP